MHPCFIVGALSCTGFALPKKQKMGTPTDFRKKIDKNFRSCFLFGSFFYRTKKYLLIFVFNMFLNTIPTHFCYTHFCYVSHFVFELLTCRRTPVAHFCYDPLTFVTLFSSREKVTKMSGDSIKFVPGRSRGRPFLGAFSRRGRF